MLVLAFIILFNINAVIMFLTMAFATWMQSIQFGQLHVVAGKAAGLLAAVTAIVLFVPFGFWLSFGVWYVAYMILFEVHPKDAMILTGVTFVLTFLVRFFFIGLFLLEG